MHWIDPAHLPEVRGRVTHFLLNPHGDIDGLVLDGRRQVHTPPHLSRTISRHIAQGDRIRVRGVKPRGADMIAAIQLVTREDRVILDEGPDHPAHPAEPRKRKPMETSGEVLLALYGPRGELRGALLETGTSLRMPPHAAAELTAYLQPGAHVQAWGDGIKTRHGATIDVSDIAELIDAQG
ncbi:hypothetical protein [Paraburkholderia acidisoli]|uniref:Uncharacterized protein n=1 Tax=Paraburkholderia acidisoli TaxID=2571748 RepID=A0A7Z2GKP2_9BURK|nr:hypothetical protein [Paraburkholderia acidisoli]QGZ63199.1 hypothetical protein FAZ98_15445 [Paraburkholderia acidisoli]